MKKEEKIPDILDDVLKKHSAWLNKEEGGERADLTHAVLRDAVLTNADLTHAVLRDADLTNAVLTHAILTNADLTNADLTHAVLRDADLTHADLTGAVLTNADLTNADLTNAALRDAILTNADLTHAVLRDAVLTNADLTQADLRDAILTNADLTHAVLRDAVLTNAVLTHAVLRGAKGLIKLMGVEHGNFYWKRIGENLQNKGYQFQVGLNKLSDGQAFAADERIICSYPGFHFSSRSWATLYYGDRPYEVKIRIPEGAQINEPWATDGKASADMIEIVQVFRDGKDVTKKFRDEP